MFGVMCWNWNAFSQPLRSNARLFWLHYSGFQASRLFERGVLFVMRVICVLCLIVVPPPPGKTPFALKINNNKKYWVTCINDEIPVRVILLS
jgi:hypothetical protein